jgi:hypothetical protein
MFCKNEVKKKTNKKKTDQVERNGAVYYNICEEQLHEEVING